MLLGAAVVTVLFLLLASLLLVLWLNKELKPLWDGCETEDDESGTAGTATREDLGTGNSETGQSHLVMLRQSHELGRHPGEISAFDGDSGELTAATAVLYESIVAVGEVTVAGKLMKETGDEGNLAAENIGEIGGVAIDEVDEFERDETGERTKDEKE